MIRLSAALAACAFALAAAPVLAQDACHVGTTHAVMDVPNAEDMPGSRFMIAPAASGCVTEDSDADFVIGDGSDPLWFADLRGDRLVLTRSTGPHGDLLVFDLTSNVLLLEVPADEFEVDDTSVAYWERLDAATAENCAQFAEYQANGFGAVIAERRIFAFAPAGVTTTGERRCDPTQ